jgi:hypothetical protein
MATDLQHASEPSLATLVGGIISDVQQLVKQEIALARREMTDELNKTKEAAISIAIGGGVALLGVLLLCLMLVYLLVDVAGLSHWLSFLIVGGGLLIIGVALLFVGKARADQVRLVPKQTAETMRENVQWLKNQT